MSEASPVSSTHLEPPSKTTELEDRGAEDHDSSSDEDHFSDASEGQKHSQTIPQSGHTSPVPRTRVERIDDAALHGEIPGTSAYNKRAQDAVPDELEVIPDGSRSRSQSQVGSPDQPLTPVGTPIPRTMVEKIDPEEPSYGEIPGTEAYEKRQADAVPDIVSKTSESESTTVSPSPDTNSESQSSQSIPETKISRVDTMPSEEELPSRPRAHSRSPSDAAPDIVETVPDTPSSPNLEIPQEPPSTENAFEDDPAAEDAKEGAADEFDEFVEEQDNMEDDDFGDFDDFDDGFQEPSAEIDNAATTTVPQQPLPTPSVPALVDFDVFKSTTDLISALQDTLDNLLPNSQDLSSLPSVEAIPDSSAIFSTERSLSLWSQLVAPPPLQPQNWVKSRIRRLFLVSLGVPVDLDEILPASKQKKLVLPSIDLEGTGATSPGNRSRSRAPQEGDPSPETQASNGPAPSRSKAGRRGAAAAPELDLSAVRRLCATTDAALDGLTDAELKTHVHELEGVTRRASELLEYWLKRRDGLVGEKEAFEGVIENLVSHVRRVRK